MSLDPQPNVDGTDVQFPSTQAGRHLWNWAPACAVMAVIFLASHTPNLSALPGGMSDHQWHFIAYAGLAGVLLRAVAQGRWTGVTVGRAGIAWLLAVGYALLDEWHQSFVPGRFPALDDVLADALGAGTAVLIILTAAIGRRLEDRKV